VASRFNGIRSQKLIKHFQYNPFLIKKAIKEFPSGIFPGQQWRGVTVKGQGERNHWPRRRVILRGPCDPPDFRRGGWGPRSSFLEKDFQEGCARAEARKPFEVRKRSPCGYLKASA